MEPTFDFQIVTLNGIPFEGKVHSLVIPGEKGTFGVLANHAALVSNCLSGKVKVRNSEDCVRWFETGKGFFEVVKNHATLLVETAKESAGQ